MHLELARHYSSIGRPSIDLELMIRVLIAGYCFAIRSSDSDITRPPFKLMGAFPHL